MNEIESSTVQLSVEFILILKYSISYWKLIEIR